MLLQNFKKTISEEQARGFPSFKYSHPKRKDAISYSPNILPRGYHVFNDNYSDLLGLI